MAIGDYQLRRFGCDILLFWSRGITIYNAEIIFYNLKSDSLGLISWNFVPLGLISWNFVPLCFISWNNWTLSIKYHDISGGGPGGPTNKA